MDNSTVKMRVLACEALSLLIIQYWVLFCNGACPTPCECTETIFGERKAIVSCSEKHLKEIPTDIPKETASLYLDRNQNIKISKTNWSSFPKLQVLSLAGNNIDYFPRGFFDGLVKLEYLNLSENNLTSIEPGLFSQLARLQDLDLGKNSLKWLEQNSFVGLKNLRHLYMSENSLSRLQEKMFNPLHKLILLRMNNNHLTTLGDSLFQGLKQLQHLEMSSNSISVVHPKCFSGLRHLEYLGLFDNQLRIIKDRTFADLSSLRMLELRDNELQLTQSELMFHGLTHLENLNLGRNQISALYDQVFSPLLQLRTLVLFGNRISSIAPEGFFGLRELTLLEISQNNITELPPHCFSPLHSLTELNANGNNIATLKTDTLRMLPNLRALFLRSNQLKWISHQSLENSRIKVLDLAHNNLRYLAKDSFASFPHLSALYLVGNELNCSCQLISLFTSLEINRIHGDCFAISDEMSTPPSPIEECESYQNGSITLTECTDCRLVPPKRFTSVVCSNFPSQPRDQIVDCHVFDIERSNEFNGNNEPHLGGTSPFGEPAWKDSGEDNMETVNTETKPWKVILIATLVPGFVLVCIIFVVIRIYCCTKQEKSEVTINESQGTNQKEECPAGNELDERQNEEQEI